MSLIEIIFTIVQIWVWIGLAVAIAFIFFGIDRIDAASHQAYAFRPLLIPGIVVLWPLVLWRWWQLEKIMRNGCGHHHKGDEAA